MKATNALVLIIFSFSSMVNTAYGAATGSIVFDPTNYVKTSLTATQSTKQVLEAIKNTRNGYEQIKHQFAMVQQGKMMIDDVRRNMKGLNRNSLTLMLEASSRPDRRLIAAEKDFLGLQNSLDESRARLQQKIAAARKTGNTLEEFTAKQQLEAARGDYHAKKELQRDVEIIREIQRQSAETKKYSEQIASENENMAALIQSLNAQTATLVSNSGMLLEYLARKNLASEERNLATREDPVEAARLYDEARKLHEKQSEEERAKIRDQFRKIETPIPTKR